MDGKRNEPRSANERKIRKRRSKKTILHPKQVQGHQFLCNYITYIQINKHALLSKFSVRICCLLFNRHNLHIYRRDAMRTTVVCKRNRDVVNSCK